jgi:hypothetical protein
MKIESSENRTKVWVNDINIFLKNLRSVWKKMSIKFLNEPEVSTSRILTTAVLWYTDSD